MKYTYEELQTMLDETEKALEKQIPKKPIINVYCGFTSYECTVFLKEVEVSDYYCRYCGQKIRKTTNN